MSDKNNISEEDYLDSLLRAITNEDVADNKPENAESEMLDELIGFEDAVGTDGSEEDFLSDFERELNISDETLYDIDNDILGAIGEAVSEEVSDTDMTSENTFVREEPEMAENSFTDEIESQLEMDSISESEELELEQAEEKAIVEEAIAQEDSSVEEDLKGLYNILGMEGAQGELPDNIEETPKKKGKKEKKKGLFSRKDKKKKAQLEEQLNAMEANQGEAENNTDAMDAFDESILSGFDDNLTSENSENIDFGLDETVSLDDSAMDFGQGFDDSIFDEMSENEQLIQQMDAGEIDEADLLSDDEPKGKKKKKKKEKKEKKEKKKKAPAKKNAKKTAKVKKEKKPKDPDDIIKIPVVFVVFAISFVAVVVLMAKIGGDYYHYNQKFYEAISLYVYGNELEEGETLDEEKYETKFTKAYSMLSGMEMKEKDHQTFYNQLETIMLMDHHYEAYKTYMLLEDFDHGLDSLIKAVKMYDKYQNQARELDCFDEMSVVLSWVNSKLESTYGLTESQARELSMLSDDNEYAVQVRTIAETARSEYEKNKVEEE